MRASMAKDMIAALGETTAGPSLTRLRDLMLDSAEGRRILKERPRVNSDTINMDRLAQYSEGTFGRAYVTWLERCGVTPDTREPVGIPTPDIEWLILTLSIRFIILMTRSWPTLCSVIENVTTFIIVSAISL